MVSEALLKLSSPVVRSCLIAISIALGVISVLIIYSATEYPFLIDHYHDHLYITSSQTIAVIFSTTSAVAIGLAISTAFVSYRKNVSNYILVHTGINGVFLPALILIFFTTASARYKPQDYVENYKHMINDYRISYGGGFATVQQQTINEQSASTNSSNKLVFSSFINHIDAIQDKFGCCGVDSFKDWIDKFNNYIAPSCCKGNSKRSTSEQWANLFKVNLDFEFEYCTEEEAYKLGCLITLKEDEHSKFSWLRDLLIFMIILTITNTFFSMILFGLNKSDEPSHYYDSNVHELSIVGVSDKPRPSQPTIIGIKPRPSVVHTLSQERRTSSRAQAVKFSLNLTPSNSNSKFSAGARRGSSFI